MKKKILIVEDSVYWQKIIKKWLEDAGYECEVEGNAIGALSRLGWEDFDVVILDWELRHWSAESVEQMVLRRGVPACYFTAHRRVDIKSKTSLPIIEKCGENEGLKGLVAEIRQLLTPGKMAVMA